MSGKNDNFNSYLGEEPEELLFGKVKNELSSAGDYNALMKVWHRIENGNIHEEQLREDKLRIQLKGVYKGKVYGLMLTHLMSQPVSEGVRQEIQILKDKNIITDSQYGNLIKAYDMAKVLKSGINDFEKIDNQAQSLANKAKGFNKPEPTLEVPSFFEKIGNFLKSIGTAISNAISNFFTIPDSEVQKINELPKSAAQEQRVRSPASQGTSNRQSPKVSPKLEPVVPKSSPSQTGPETKATNEIREKIVQAAGSGKQLKTMDEQSNRLEKGAAKFAKNPPAPVQHESPKDVQKKRVEKPLTAESEKSMREIDRMNAEMEAMAKKVGEKSARTKVPESAPEVQVKPVKSENATLGQKVTIVSSDPSKQKGKGELTKTVEKSKELNSEAGDFAGNARKLAEVEKDKNKKSL